MGKRLRRTVHRQPLSVNDRSEAPQRAPDGSAFQPFRDYICIGGMPEVVSTYIKNNNFSGTLSLQKQLLKDYEEDITKYVEGLDKAKVKAVYNHIPTFLAKENKRFQITKIGRNARNRDYVSSVEWLADAGIVNLCYCLNYPELPLKGNYDPKLYKILFQRHWSSHCIARRRSTRRFAR